MLIENRCPRTLSRSGTRQGNNVVVCRWKIGPRDVG